MIIFIEQPAGSLNKSSIVQNLIANLSSQKVFGEVYFEMPKQDQFYQSPIESLQSFSVYFFSWYVIFCVDIAPIFQMQNAAWNHGGSISISPPSQKLHDKGTHYHCRIGRHWAGGGRAASRG